jgi:RNA polymerase-associated protein LEO1
MLHPGPLRLAKLSNVLAIEPRPFDPATYELEAAEYVDERGRKRVRMGDNAMRWRWAEAAPGEPPRRESNARLVRWSDGSVQLAVGDEFFDARDIDVASDQGFLFARHPNLIQGQARLSTKLVFRPASLTGGSHARLAAAVDRQQAGSRQQRVRATTTLVDPRREKEARERAEEAVIKDKERLVDRQARQMKKWAPPPAQRYPALDAGYLEEEEEEEDDGFIVPDDSGDEGDRRPRRPLGADEEAAAAARLAAAKAGGAPPPPGARRPAPAPDSEDEDEDISGDEEEMRGFIVGEGEGEEAEEAAGPRPAAGAPPPKKKRAVVFDSDDD